VQLDLPLWSKTSLKRAIADYMLCNGEGLADGTLNDYAERATWLLRTFGENAALDSFTFDLLFATARKSREVLADITIKRRFDFLRWVLEFAAGRDIIAKVPMFPKLRGGGHTISKMHTVGEAEVFRRYLPPGPFRKVYDLCFWTLQHVPDVMSMQRWMLDVDRPVLDERGVEVARGCFWRRNQKNNNPRKERRPCEPIWIPMQPELKLLIAELLDGVPSRRDAPIAGKLWNLQRTFNAAHCRAVSDGHAMPRPTPNDLRRSGASMLVARGYPEEAVRMILGHTGVFRAPGPGESLQKLAGYSTTATRHYLFAAPGLFVGRPQ
jgi:hypothetical protein